MHHRVLRLHSHHQSDFLIGGCIHAPNCSKQEERNRIRHSFSFFQCSGRREGHALVSRKLSCPNSPSGRESLAGRPFGMPSASPGTPTLAFPTPFRSLSLACQNCCSEGSGVKVQDGGSNHIQFVFSARLSGWWFLHHNISSAQYNNGRFPCYCVWAVQPHRDGRHPAQTRRLRHIGQG